MKNFKQAILFLILAAFLTLSGCCLMHGVHGHGPCGCKKPCDTQQPCPTTPGCDKPGCVKPATPTPAQ